MATKFKQNLDITGNISLSGTINAQGNVTLGDADTDKTAQNELFDTLDDTVLDFTESNPFGDAGSL